MAVPQRILQIMITLALLIFCILMALYPAETWHAGVRGLSIWWDVLFPSLFPFLVLSESRLVLASCIFWEHCLIRLCVLYSVFPEAAASFLQ